VEWVRSITNIYRVQEEPVHDHVAQQAARAGRHST
jgi:hypothetical protein